MEKEIAKQRHLLTVIPLEQKDKNDLFRSKVIIGISAIAFTALGFMSGKFFTSQDFGGSCICGSVLGTAVGIQFALKSIIYPAIRNGDGTPFVKELLKLEELKAAWAKEKKFGFKPDDFGMQNYGQVQGLFKKVKPKIQDEEED